ncbi:hypothetical protein ACJX0J_035225, partial [Zea mays]
MAHHQSEKLSILPLLLLFIIHWIIGIYALGIGSYCHARGTKRSITAMQITTIQLLKLDNNIVPCTNLSSKYGLNLLGMHAKGLIIKCAHSSKQIFDLLIAYSFHMDQIGTTYLHVQLHIDICMSYYKNILTRNATCTLLMKRLGIYRPVAVRIEVILYLCVFYIFTTSKLITTQSNHLTLVRLKLIIGTFSIIIRPQFIGPNTAAVAWHAQPPF